MEEDVKEEKKMVGRASEQSRRKLTTPTTPSERRMISRRVHFNYHYFMVSRKSI